MPSESGRGAQASLARRNRAVGVEPTGRPFGGHWARVTLEPLERGVGHTLGASLRLALLSSLPGCAPTEVVFAGVLHEQSALDGVEEDLVRLALNLKSVVFRLHDRDQSIVTLLRQSAGTVTAADILTPQGVDIVNAEHVIAHLSPDGRLDMQIRVEAGCGYVPGSLQRHGGALAQRSGHLVLDASFSPVRRASYTVEDVRVGQRTDLDRLVLEIETDGSMAPEQAVRKGAQLLMQRLPFGGSALGTMCAANGARRRCAAPRTGGSCPARRCRPSA